MRALSMYADGDSRFVRARARAALLLRTSIIGVQIGGASGSGAGAPALPTNREPTDCEPLLLSSSARRDAPVIGDERRDEIVPIIVTFFTAPREPSTRLSASGLEPPG